MYTTDVNLSTQVLIRLSFNAVVFFERRIWEPGVSLSQFPTVSWITSPTCFTNMNRMECETLTRHRSAAWKLSTPYFCNPGYLLQTCVKTITVKFHCLKMHVIQLPLCSSRPTCKFHLVTFTTKFHYLQIQCPIAELRPIRQRPSFHPPKHLEWRPLCSKISDKMPHTANIAACNISFAVNRLYNTHSFLCAW